jgi:tRNA pseudouridine38-40 synthase
MPRIRLTLQYQGSRYHGWQVQPGQPTIQGTIQDALGKIASAPVSLVASGRTDSGVHALAQVAHFDTERVLSMDTWPKAINANLPDDIVVLAAALVDDRFHARYLAEGKHYCYRILNRPMRCPFRRDRAWHVPQALDVAAMSKAAQHLTGDHDYTSFRASGCGADTPNRTVHRIDVRSDGDEIVFEVTGRGFLKQMVRNLVGTLVEVGHGRQVPAWAAQVLTARDRCAAGPTAPAHGLTLVSVDYGD